MRIATLLAFLGTFSVSALYAELPPGFQRTVLVEGLCQPSSIVLTPDGRVFVGQAEGVIHVIEDDVLLTTPLIALEAAASNEQGLCGMALDPEFELNGYFYVYYTSVAEERNRVSRFTVVGNTADLSTELVLWENTPSPTTTHQGGGLAFGSDGTLFIGTGDQGFGGSAQLFDSYNGKILRIHTDGSIPADNPFVGVPGFEPEIWATGLRNPYRLTFDDLQNKLWIGDIGTSGGGAWEEVNLGVPGANYGWNDGEGSDCFVTDCTGHMLPIHSYRHDDLEFATPTLNACVITGPVYRAGAFPVEYDGNLFYGDWSGQWIRRMVFDSTGDVLADVVFDSAPDAGNIADFAVGPTGDLYCVTVGAPWCFPPDEGTVYRIAWVGTPPVVVADSDVTLGAQPLTVQFSSSGTDDPDAGPSPLTYAWNFGDGCSSTDPDPSRTYASIGSYSAVLTVSDGQYAVSSSPIAVLVGDPPQLRRGDCNGDTSFDVADVIFHLDVLFAFGTTPGCEDACDSNDDGRLDIADPILSLTALFTGGQSLPAPHPLCGFDSGLDALGCLDSVCP